MSTPGNPERRLAAYTEEQQEEQQESGPKPTQLKRYRGGAQQESRLRRAGK